jgi:FAD/FMN-containing dehydrogenase
VQPARITGISADEFAGNCSDEDPTSVNAPFAADPSLPCIPSTNASEPCRLGNFPNYVIDASTVRHVQRAVNFARTENIRLVIKNTGHDFLGKSAGGNSLSVWTHHLNDISYIPVYTGKGWKGPVFKVGAGVQARELYDAARLKGVVVVGGEGIVSSSS